MMQLLIASNNPGKISEVKQILQDLPLQVVSPIFLAKDNKSFVGLPKFEVAETGLTYQENALLKAQSFAEKTNFLAIADDSGLEVKSLENFPGVKSKRWLLGTDAERNIKLLEKLKDISDRSARFISVVCLYNPQDNSHYFFEGYVSGKIALQPRGETGFGYDPIFIPEGYTETFAQLGVEEKNQLSHRKKALEKLKEFLKTNL